MFFEALDRLTADHIRQLAAAGIPASRVSNWKHRKRLPTRPQTVILCAVLKLDFDRVNREITEIELIQDAQQNSLMAAVLKNLTPAWHFS